MAEGQFILRKINQDILLFYHVLGALPELEFQRMDKLLSAQHLGGQKPQPTCCRSMSSILSRGRVSVKDLPLSLSTETAVGAAHFILSDDKDSTLPHCNENPIYVFLFWE
jgi:hypothetical protein